MRKTFLTKAIVGVLVAATMLGSFVGFGTANTTKAATVSDSYHLRDAHYKMYVKQDLNARKGPGKTYKVVTTLSKGEKVTVIGEAYKEDHRLGWAKLKYNGKKVFVSDKYLSKKKVSPAKKNVKSVVTVKESYATKKIALDCNVRAAASKTAKSIKILKKGTKVQVIGICYKNGEKLGWSKVVVDNKAGYISDKCFSKAAKDSTATYTVKKASATMYAKGNVNVRKTPSTSAEILKVLKKGKKVTVTGVVYKDNVKTKWYKVSVKGVTGFMSNLTVDL